jgi:hypothetical protein
VRLEEDHLGVKDPRPAAASPTRAAAAAGRSLLVAGWHEGGWLRPAGGRGWLCGSPSLCRPPRRGRIRGRRGAALGLGADPRGAHVRHAGRAEAGDRRPPARRRGRAGRAAERRRSPAARRPCPAPAGTRPGDPGSAGVGTAVGSCAHHHLLPARGALARPADPPRRAVLPSVEGTLAGACTLAEAGSEAWAGARAHTRADARSPGARASHSGTAHARAADTGPSDASPADTGAPRRLDCAAAADHRRLAAAARSGDGAGDRARRACRVNAPRPRLR